MADVRVLYFAVVRELVDLQEESFPHVEGQTVAQLLQTIQQRHPRLDGLLERVSVAVNHTYAAADTVVPSGAEVALIPPVAGGSGMAVAATSETLLASSTDLRLQLRLDALVAAEVETLVAREEAGAIVTFTGMIRRQSQGREVRWLEYEAYPPMVLAELERIRASMRERWPTIQLAIHHRVGTLQIGENAVVIAVASPHRQEGFAACSFAIERLKETVPIWKKEFFTDGTTWVGWGP